MLEGTSLPKISQILITYWKPYVKDIAEKLPFNLKVILSHGLETQCFTRKREREINPLKNIKHSYKETHQNLISNISIQHSSNKYRAIQI